MDNCGEMWTLSGVSGSETIVENGFLAGNNLAELTEIYMDELLGSNVYEKFGETFPILVKFIDAAEDLSIQVHPNDELAKKRHHSLGKTEMWYVMDTDPGARLITGFNQPMNKETYLAHLKNNTLEEILHVEQVKKGDVFYQPAGRVHAICKGTLLAEIQQSSDVTYRIYDYNRKDKNGNTRELHTELALEAIDFKTYDKYRTEYTERKNQTTPVVKSPYFTTNLLSLDMALSKNYEELDSFVIHTCVEGRYGLIFGEQKSVKIEKGESVLIPAVLSHITMVPDGHTKILETYMELDETVKTEKI